HLHPMTVLRREDALFLEFLKTLVVMGLKFPDDGDTAQCFGNPFQLRQVEDFRIQRTAEVSVAIGHAKLLAVVVLVDDLDASALQPRNNALFFALPAVEEPEHASGEFLLLRPAEDVEQEARTFLP